MPRIPPLHFTSALALSLFFPMGLTPAFGSGGFCSQQAYFSQDRIASLRRRVQQLDHMAELPDGLFQDYTVNEIAEAIVGRIRALERNLSAEVPSVSADLRQDSQLIILFDSKNAPLIQAQGFLNYFQTAHSQGHDSYWDREIVENNLVGLKLPRGDIQNFLRPKFSYLNLSTQENLGWQKGSLSAYGNVGAVLKPHVLNRATWTNADSLQMMHRLTQRTGEDRNIPGPFKVTNLDPSQLRPYCGTFDRGTFPTQQILSSYNEAQIWGTLTLEDVDYFLFDDVITDRRKIRPPAEWENLKRLGKPIYKTVKYQPFGRTLFVRDQLLFDGKDRK
ncbi:MAG: hypothetical protein K2X47_07670 [Bdellovibrionales bacterium]|nr:hypothetical protein [Bdellovibrionales bacterium]